MSDGMKRKNGETTLADVVDSIEKLGDRFDKRIDLLDRNLSGRIDQVNGRLDNVLKMLGGYHRDHERRIVALERSLAALKRSA